MLNTPTKGATMNSYFDMDLASAVGSARMGDAVVWVFWPSPTGGASDSLIKSIQCRDEAQADALMGLIPAVEEV